MLQSIKINSSRSLLPRSSGFCRPEDGGSKIIRNVDIIPQHYTTSQPRKLPFESSLPWKIQISYQDEMASIGTIFRPSITEISV